MRYSHFFKYTAFSLLLSVALSLPAYTADASVKHSKQFNTYQHNTPLHSHHNFKLKKNRHHHAKKGRVLSVTPIYQRVRMHHQNGYSHYSPSHRRPHLSANIGAHGGSIAPITGAIIGGVIGNQFGSGNGNKVATVAGAILGSAIGSNIHSNGGHNSSNITISQHSHIVHNRHNRRGDGHRFKRELVAYRVEYQYRGKVYTTRTQFYPGKYIYIEY